MEIGLALAIIGIGIAVGLPGAGSSIGIGTVGRIANGVLSEDPEKFGKLLPLVILPGTQGLYGFIIGFLIIMKIGLLGDPVALSTEQGLEFLFGALPIGITGLISGIKQGEVAAAGASMLAKKPQEVGKALTTAGIVEIYAALGLIISFFIVFIGIPV